MISKKCPNGSGSTVIDKVKKGRKEINDNGLRRWVLIDGKGNNMIDYGRINFPSEPIKNRKEILGLDLCC